MSQVYLKIGCIDLDQMVLPERYEVRLIVSHILFTVITTFPPLIGRLTWASVLIIFSN
jgi:hypothetical protein